VGVLLFQNCLRLDWREPEDSVPAFVTLFLIPMTYSILNGVLVGYCCYMIINACSGDLFDKARALCGDYIPESDAYFHAIGSRFPYISRHYRENRDEKKSDNDNDGKNSEKEIDKDMEARNRSPSSAAERLHTRGYIDQGAHTKGNLDPSVRAKDRGYSHDSAESSGTVSSRNEHGSNSDRAASSLQLPQQLQSQSQIQSQLIQQSPDAFTSSPRSRGRTISQISAGELSRSSKKESGTDIFSFSQTDEEEVNGGAVPSRPRAGTGTPRNRYFEAFF
jgi:hypothetical protein